MISEINKDKEDAGYVDLRNNVIAMNKLEATKASPETWESSKALLKTIGTSEDEIEQLHDFMLQNQDKNWNYRQLVIIYEQKKKLN